MTYTRIILELFFVGWLFCIWVSEGFSWSRPAGPVQGNDLEVNKGGTSFAC
jgi:hypothetical protein